MSFPPPTQDVILRAARGFSNLFWSLPLLLLAQAVTLWGLLPPYITALLLPLCFLPLITGLHMTRPSHGPSPQGAWALLAVAMALSPFLSWWSQAPAHLYFAANVVAHSVVLLLLLLALDHHAARFAASMGENGLRREANAGFGMVLWLGVCTLSALVWLFYRSGILAAGLDATLMQLSLLPSEARYLFLLPYIMTAYVLWRTKETAFRRASSTPAA
ncbi:MAG: hypothetical protein LBN38_02725 [Verrucomicrobiota bacterium]|jgi:hypothetical protein|nr:hypothetical protein [Verrucomicrobiota bacterium]